MKSLLLTIFLSSLAFCDISVYIKQSNKTLHVSEKTVSKLFLKKQTQLNGMRLTPVDSKNQKLLEEFYKKIVNKTPAQLRAYWVKQIYRGTTLPPKKLSTSAIAKRVKKGSHFITYSKHPKTGQFILTII